MLKTSSWMNPACGFLGIPTASYLCHFNSLDVLIVYGISGSDSTPQISHFLCKGLDSEHLSFVVHLFSFVTAQLCCCSAQSAIDNMYTNRCGCVPIKLYSHTQAVGEIGPPAVVC